MVNAELAPRDLRVSIPTLERLLPVFMSWIPIRTKVSASNAVISAI